MDRLEQFIMHHRRDLDPYKPDDKVWKNIRHETGIARRRMRLIFSRAAVAILLLAGSGSLFWFAGGRDTYLHYKASATGNYPQVRETENYYNTLLDKRMAEAKPILSKYPGLQEELSVEMEVLDSIGWQIKEDLKDQVATEEVLEALIQNYRIRISLLEDLLRKIATEETTERQTGSYDL